jgi:hypothetical protein
VHFDVLVRLWNVWFFLPRIRAAGLLCSSSLAKFFVFHMSASESVVCMVVCRFRFLEEYVRGGTTGATPAAAEEERKTAAAPAVERKASAAAAESKHGKRCLIGRLRFAERSLPRFSGAPGLLPLL